ncbi:MAG TPA: hypothetical protein VLR71_05815 [Casimicrobiaceae bacterium]|nr:hypothetical protein [Casimicrobiaceae bacterium]
MSDPGSSPAHERVARAVPTGHVLAWYGEAMRLWRVAPGTFAALAAVAIGGQVLLELIPIAGVLIEQVVVPLLECSLLYASLAADRGDKPRMRHLLAVLGAPVRAQITVVAAGLLTFGIEVYAIDAVTGIDLLSPMRERESEPVSTLLLIVAINVLASLPFMFVAPAALLDDAGFAAAFRASMNAYARNVLPLLLYGVLVFGFTLFGLITSGIGLLLAGPWVAASSYAAWKDVFDVEAGRRTA